MKIAVTYENGQIFQHFGHTEMFKVYEVEDGQIKNTDLVSALGSGHGALAGFLTDDTCLCPLLCVCVCVCACVYMHMYIRVPQRKQIYV